MTKTQEKPPASKPEAVVSAPYRELSRGDVELKKIITLVNHRSKMDKKRLEELADSIKKVGMLEPVLLRPAKDDYYLVAGYRRFEAAQMAGLKAIPARVLELTQQQAEEVQALENLHREDLGPIDEAKAFKTLLDSGKYDVKGLAERIDKSMDYVYRALRLLELPEAGLSALEKGEITPAHAHVILRASAKHHEALVKYALEYRTTVTDLRQEVERTIEKPLHRAYFDAKTACSACEYNSSNQNMLIPDVQEGRCLNPACYAKKNAEAAQEFADKAASRFPGLKYVGVGKTNNYSSQQVIGKFPVVNSKEMGKLTKEHPDWFGYGVLKPSEWGSDNELHAYLVCIQPDKLPKKAQPAGSQEVQRSPRDLFIEQKLAEAIDQAFEDELKKADEKTLVGYFRSSVEWGIKEALKKYGLNQKKLSTTDCLRLSVEIMAGHNYSGAEDELELLGVDVKALEKRLRPQFAKEFDDQEAAKKKPEAKKPGKGD